MNNNILYTTTHSPKQQHLPGNILKDSNGKDGHFSEEAELEGGQCSDHLELGVEASAARRLL